MMLVADLSVTSASPVARLTEAMFTVAVITVAILALHTFILAKMFNESRITFPQTSVAVLLPVSSTSTSVSVASLTVDLTLLTLAVVTEVERKVKQP